jgi:hypothetical protein
MSSQQQQQQQQLQQLQRKCGFCCQPGHTIGHCNSPAVAQLHQKFLDKLAHIRRPDSPFNISQQSSHFKGWLIGGLMAPEIKVIAKRFYNYSGAPQNKEALAEFIVNVIFPEEELREVRQRDQAIFRMHQVAGVYTSENRRMRIAQAEFQEAERRFNALRQVHEDNLRIYRQNLRSRQEAILQAIMEAGAIMPGLDSVAEEMTEEYLESRNDRERSEIILTAVHYIRDPESFAFLSHTPRGPPPTRKIDVILEGGVGVEETDCPVCYIDDLKIGDMVKTGCGHSFCKECICRHIDSVPMSRGVACPMCREPVARLVVMKSEYCEEIGSKYSGMTA